MRTRSNARCQYADIHAGSPYPESMPTSKLANTTTTHAGTWRPAQERPRSSISVRSSPAQLQYHETYRNQKALKGSSMRSPVSSMSSKFHNPRLRSIILVYTASNSSPTPLPRGTMLIPHPNSPMAVNIVYHPQVFDAPWVILTASVR